MHKVMQGGKGQQRTFTACQCKAHLIMSSSKLSAAAERTSFTHLDSHVSDIKLLLCYVCAYLCVRVVSDDTHTATFLCEHPALYQDA